MSQVSLERLTIEDSSANIKHFVQPVTYAFQNPSEEFMKRADRPLTTEEISPSKDTRIRNGRNAIMNSRNVTTEPDVAFFTVTDSI